MFFGHHHGERAALGSIRRAGASPPIGIIGLGYPAEDEEPSGSWMKLRRRSLESNPPQRLVRGVLATVTSAVGDSWRVTEPARRVHGSARGRGGGQAPTRVSLRWSGRIAVGSNASEASSRARQSAAISSTNESSSASLADSASNSDGRSRSGSGRPRAIVSHHLELCIPWTANTVIGLLSSPAGRQASASGLSPSIASRR